MPHVRRGYHQPDRLSFDPPAAFSSEQDALLERSLADDLAIS